MLIVEEGVGESEVEARQGAVWDDTSRFVP